MGRRETEERRLGRVSGLERAERVGLSSTAPSFVAHYRRAWTLHKQFNPESISSNMFEARPQAILQRFPVGEGMPMETLLNLIGEHAVVQRPMRHGHPNTHTMTQQTPMGLMEVTVSDGSHHAGPGGPSSFMSMFDDFDRMFHQMDGLGGGGDRRRR